MYTFVADKLDVAYLSAIPENHIFQGCDVPEEEIELREIIEIWYESSFLPAFNLQKIEIANKPEFTIIQTHVLNNDTSTLAFLLKNRVYRAALNRVLGVWTLEPSAKKILERLLFELNLDNNRPH
ncbi:hypothetical protein AB4455_09075 [Vibrio sp. 10N.261.46.E12]|uniref:hypothetical protein n=1 Tax=unclassified Vibrio TaxID=2614977 RepID=UPI0009785403|nr:MULTISPECIES: hypothetical protein [unclassified Vibrio]OMO37099.1 hypothetical protein BH584_24020 [Vibrio sp. 10N.261.45.E1]PMJ19608.1 hypothetical protein BCU27_20940 [Vibrio sp. 10N.286.45.B6]PML93492.1 hypothetical protein BCT66_24655 [Vibrio sp. 10N.261.49.E11]PMM66639.1 hypothetical protein BCT48_16885 [Vibrio sp. 10N.261.46.F12]PMM86374.1 hypothetical protein BCT46_08495 [Vibrio sp. 10N.261.46.E8]